jgi:peptidoglycan/LPS O-acetylase OafA/YrhL
MTKGNTGSTASLLSAFLKRRGTGLLIIGIGVIGYLVAFCFLPDFSSTTTRNDYAPFFTAAGTVAAGIFVALAVASREVTSDVVLGISTVFFVGTAALASVLALVPGIYTFVYGCAFIAVIGGGVSGMISTGLIAAVGLLQARAEREAKTLDALQLVAQKIEADLEASKRDTAPPATGGVS